MSQNSSSKQMKSSKEKTRELTLAAILCATGVVIVLFSPFKILLEPASFTLASHVAIFLAMFVSPSVAVAVTVVTAVAFFLAGFPFVVAARAASQIVFVVAGSKVLAKNPEILTKKMDCIWFGIWTAVLHAIAEVIVVLPFYFSNAMSAMYYEKGYVDSIFILVGVGTVIHSLVDYSLALLVWKAIRR